MEIHSKKTVKEHWEAVVREYMVKGVYAQTEIRVKFLLMRCPEKGNTKEFLRGLRLKREELVQVGVKISNEEYLSTIISSLPDPLANFTSLQMSWALQHTSKPIDANTLMTMLLQEAKRQTLLNQRHKQVNGKSKEEDGEALVVSDDKPRGKKNLGGKILCWGCGKEGNLKYKCPEPQKTNNNTKKGPESSKSETKATANIIEVTSDDEGAWAAEEQIIGSGSDWFEEVIEEESLKGRINDLKEVVDVEFKLIGNVVEEEMANVMSVEGGRAEVFGDMSGEVFIVAESVQASAKAELYDSGCTNHISPYKSSFDDFQIIETRHF